MKLLADIQKWWAGVKLRRLVVRESDKLAEYLKIAPVPLDVVGAENICDHYGNPEQIGTVQCFEVVDGKMVMLDSRVVVAEQVKVRLPDGRLHLGKVMFVEGAQPWIR